MVDYSKSLESLFFRVVELILSQRLVDFSECYRDSWQRFNGKKNRESRATISDSKHTAYEICSHRIPDVTNFVALIGRYFQIRDDYQNLVSADVNDLSQPHLDHSSIYFPSLALTDFVNPQYTNQKGFCEDLDEGKYSLPLIHALNTEPSNIILRSILQERRIAGKLTFELKQNILAHMKRTKSLEYTKGVLEDLFTELENEIEKIEKSCGTENYIIRLVLERLKVQPREVEAGLYLSTS